LLKCLYSHISCEINGVITDMPGTKAGGQKAAATNRARHGNDFYARIGAVGGTKGTTGGFAANRELAREAGRKGGMISRRRKSAAKQTVKKSDFELAA
jgi:general stress protein YciG